MPSRPARVARRAMLLMAALPVVAVVRVMLTVASYRAVLALIPKGRTRTAHPALSLRVGVAVGGAARWVPRASCLTQALAAHYILALRGCASDIRVGVKVGANNRVEAHAWLVSGPVVVVGGTPDEIAGYAPLTDLPRAMR